MGVKVFDAHNDSRLDILIVDMHSDMWMGLDLSHGSLKLATDSKNKKFKSIFGPMKQQDNKLVEAELTCVSDTWRKLALRRLDGDKDGGLGKPEIAKAPTMIRTATTSENMENALNA